MENTNTYKLLDSYKKAFIDSTTEADPAFATQLVTNTKGQKVISVLQNELNVCDDMFMSVAFITQGGIEPLLGNLMELKEKGKKGKILTTDYLMFSEPKALDTLAQLDNIELRMFKTTDNNVGFHTKGYMFHNNNNLRVIIGSSNLTQSAITKNQEWNIRIVSSCNGQYAKDVEDEFNLLWNNSVMYNEYRKEYIELFKKNKEQRIHLKEITQELDTSFSKELTPNEMQLLFIKNIEDIIVSGGKRALLISATGTGKTYASAFAIKKLYENKVFKQNKKVLFLSHRERINKQALKSYHKIFGNNISMALLSGSHNDSVEIKNSMFLFSTMNMMSKSEIYNQFNKDEFTVIVLDECHRAGSISYNKIINYFNPELLLGMSASPERCDGFDIYSLFDHNVACEIRLQQALKDDLLCPFHYFGITDFYVDDEATECNKFSQLISDERVKYIIQKAEYYSFSGDRVKGLIFCSTKKEALELSNKFNATGKYNTIMLSGDDTQERRDEGIEKLVSDERDDKLDYIFTVDIFNEGVDIPEINQVILLRPTESPIIFVQQLGRGLRKCEGKEFVVIIDFIGNYNNNYMIPIALCGDKTGNKDNIRRNMMRSNNTIDGASTIYFDEISRNRIYASIDSAKLNTYTILRDEYYKIKNRLGRIPKMIEFDEFGEMDPLRMIAYSNSYHKFLKRVESTDYQISLSNKEEEFIDFVSIRFAAGKRIHELLLLKLLIDMKQIDNEEYERHLREKYNIQLNEFSRNNIYNVLTNKFFRAKAISSNFIEKTNNIIKLSNDLSKSLGNPEFRKMFTELIDFGIHRYERDYSNNYMNTSFNLYQKYTYTDVCWLLNWDKEEVAQNIGGYKFEKKTKTYPVFINYIKDENISETIKYEDRFIDQSTLIAISKSNRHISSDDVTNSLNSVERGIMMPLFVRKNKDDKTSKEFYFLGTMIPIKDKAKEIDMPNTGGKSAVELHYHLNTPVEHNIYEYITENKL